MKFSYLLAFLLFLFISNYSISQVDADVPIEQSPLFTEAESEYIDQWFTDFVEEMNLSEEVALQYQSISDNYSKKFDAIGKDDPDICKSEIIRQFNALMESQHEEVKSVLTDKQYEMYYDTMEKVVLSINQRLKQL